MTIWGNHSATQYPDLFHAEVSGKNAAEVVGDQTWLEHVFIPTVAKRGAAIIEARGASSAASAASATVDARPHLAARAPRTGDWVSMAVCSDGSYGVPEGTHLVVPGDRRGRSTGRSCRAWTSTSSPAARIDASVAELVDERNAVTELEADLTRRSRAQQVAAI